MMTHDDWLSFQYGMLGWEAMMFLAIHRQIIIEAQASLISQWEGDRLIHSQMMQQSEEKAAAVLDSLRVANTVIKDCNGHQVELQKKVDNRGKWIGILGGGSGALLLTVILLSVK
jgi:hypothetical protein